MPPSVLVERQGSVGVVTLNRPAKLNALNREVVDGLAQAIHDLQADTQIGAIVITGAGERAFSAGGDMAEQVAVLDGQVQPHPSSLSLALRACPTPILAAIRGYCYGGGALLAVNCDIRVGGSDARFKFHGAGYGRAVGGAALPRIVGDAKARELLFTADEVCAAEALRIGLLNQVVPPEDVLPTAVAMGARISTNSRTAVRAIKQAINLALPIDRALDEEARADREAEASADGALRFRAAAARVLGQPRDEQRAP